MYQEILHDSPPDLIIETGTYSGGSALFLASMVILDSDHSKEHVLTELREYATLVSEDCCLIVEEAR